MNSVLNILKKTSVLLSNLLLVTAVYSQTAVDPAGTGTFSGQTLPPGVNQHEITDDGWQEIPLEHPFPFYGQTFTNSWMLSNGIVAFMDPTQSGMFGACCNGIDFETQLQQNPNFSAPQFSYMLAPLWTDLRDYNAYDENGDGIEDTGFFSESTPDYTRYLWQNISEFGQPNNLNTFGAEIRPDGSYAFFYDKVNITNHQVWIGSTGAMYGTTGSLEFDQQYFGNGADLSNVNGGMVEFDYNGGAVDCSSPLNDPSCPGYNEAYFEQQCDANQLYDPQCPGYEQAYLDQQCSADPLYDPSCPGYQDAYFNQQCSIDPLYDPGCPGYAEAYFNQECSIDPLYDPYCPGYEQAYLDQQCSTDSLYDPSCPGYEQAYYDQQCSTDPLYDSGCPGYAEAYYDQQCALDPLYDSGCPGHEQAVFDQQCGIDALYDPACPGHDAAVYNQQCSINPLYDSGCPGYQQAYFDQQCAQDALYNTSCPGYEQAYFDQQCSTDSLYDPSCPGYEQAFFDQQCSIDALYDVSCPGYEQAFFDQQCASDPLYDSGCPSYDEAYYDQQCSSDPLYDSGCPGYDEAYYDQQCSLDPLYDSGCPGYDKAYFDQQCSINALYDTQCPGYDEAYFIQQCDLDPLYDQGCSGYAEKAQELQFEAQCAADPLSNLDCPGYDLAQAQQQADQLTTTSTLDVNNQSSVVENTVENIQTEPVVQETQEIAQEAGTQDTIEETVLEESAAVSENSETVAQPAEPNELQTTSTSQSTVASNEPTADLLDIVENVLAADRDLVEKSIAETVQTSVSQSRSSNANPGSAQTGAVSQQDTAGPGSLFEMANTASNQLQSNSGSQSIESVGNSNSSGQSLATDSLSNNLAMGGSLSSAISNPGAPLPVLPTVRQPSRDQQQQLDKAESLAEQMSEEELEEIAEQRMASMEDDGGFDQDQTVTVLIMNSQNNINAYYNTVDLQTASSRQQWYLGEEIYKNRTMRDNIGSFYVSAGKSEKVLREMIEDQYRRNTDE